MVSSVRFGLEGRPTQLTSTFVYHPGAFSLQTPDPRKKSLESTPTSGDRRYLLRDVERRTVVTSAADETQVEAC